VDSTEWRGTYEGGKLKETGTTHWNSPNTGATNESGFSALPGGVRATDNKYCELGNVAYFWTATEYRRDGAWLRILVYSSSKVIRTDSDKRLYCSVRCVRD
ncbi:unnamed protein product, partial [marine sediment metagenome]